MMPRNIKFEKYDSVLGKMNHFQWRGRAEFLVA
jgi:hypothetical protein